MISLESVDEPEQVVPEPEVVPVPEVTEPDVAPDAAPDVIEEPPGLNDIEEVPVPKRRGRPPKAKAEAPKARAPKAAPKTAAKNAPKAAPKTAPKRAKTRAPSVSSDESSDDVALSRDDMDTLLMQYMLDRKTNQRDQRRTMWRQMAGLV